MLRWCGVIGTTVVVAWGAWACRPEEPGLASGAAPSPACTRIIALAPNAAEIICELGACDRLVGVSSFSTYPSELADVPKIGGLRDPDLELILAISPDLLVLRGRSEPLQQLARDHGIIIYDDGVETLDDLYGTITDLGDLLGRRAQAVAVIHGIRKELASVSAQAADRPKVKVLFTLRSPAALRNVLTVGKETFINELIEIAGGHNVFGDHTTRYPIISLEEIVGRNPEVIIEAMAGERIDAPRRAALMDQWRALGPVKAVQDQRVYFVTEEYLTIPSHRVTLAARKLLSLIHPELDPDE